MLAPHAHGNQSSPSIMTPMLQWTPYGGPWQCLGLSGGWQWGLLGKWRPMPAVTVTVWLENTQCHDYLWTQVGHIQESSAVFMITAPCCFQVCSFAWNNKPNSLLFLAQEHKLASPGKYILTARLEIKRNTGRKESRPSLPMAGFFIQGKKSLPPRERLRLPQWLNPVLVSYLLFALVASGSCSSQGLVERRVLPEPQSTQS